ncbi:hypothetical protein Pla108_00720 [Botrimarina colliarenosi]|uniref:Uncharacterized protein n=1 Tax=Botrimarina colliarenosi TaxID=2528001 RepID=A0A5C6AHN1_9BACT|nr:hypothetical protein [Botrimarina colliarenosi]TWT99139.1 hypothetical protein Pla108_00720 [Botrimarina colliarenosi]
MSRAFKSCFALSLLGFVGLFAGCSNKEKVVDVETPNRDVEVTRDTETGEVDIDVERE